MRQPGNLLASDLPQRCRLERISRDQASTRCASNRQQHRNNHHSSFHESLHVVEDGIKARWFVSIGYVMENTKE
jgi:hypothetical protein